MLPAMPPEPISSPPTHSAVLDRIRAFAREKRWRPGTLAAKAGLSRGTLGPLFDPDWSPSSATIRACEALIPADWQPGGADSNEAASAAA